MRRLDGCVINTTAWWSTSQGSELVLRRADGTLATINPRKVTKLSVYYSEKAEFAPGTWLGSTATMPDWISPTATATE